MKNLAAVDAVLFPGPHRKPCQLVDCSHLKDPRRRLNFTYLKPDLTTGVAKVNVGPTLAWATQVEYSYLDDLGVDQLAVHVRDIQHIFNVPLKKHVCLEPTHYHAGIPAMPQLLWQGDVFNSQASFPVPPVLAQVQPVQAALSLPQYTYGPAEPQMQPSPSMIPLREEQRQPQPYTGYPLGPLVPAPHELMLDKLLSTLSESSTPLDLEDLQLLTS